MNVAHCSKLKNRSSYNSDLLLVSNNIDLFAEAIKFVRWPLKSQGKTIHFRIRKKRKIFAKIFCTIERFFA